MNKRKSIFVLSSAALASAVLFGVAASSTFLKVNDSVGADAAAFSAPAADFNLVGEEYVGVAVGDGGNSVRAKISGVTKNEHGLSIAAGQYACFTNIDPLRSIDAIGLTFGTEVTGVESNGLLFFSSRPLELENIFAGFYSDIYYTPISAYHGGSGQWSYNLPSPLTESYRYVLGLIDAPMESPIIIKSLSFSTPCASEPEPAEEGTFTDWDDDVKADMTSVIGAPLPALGHNVYNSSLAYHQIDFATANVAAAQTYFESILAQGYSLNYQQAYSSTAFMFILQKRLAENKVASIQFVIYMTPSGLSRAMLAYTDMMDWMGSIDHWPAENIAEHFSSDLAAALAPLQFDGISFLEAAETSPFCTQVAYLITPTAGMTSEVVTYWAAAMETKGWSVSVNTYGSDSQVTCRMTGHPDWEVMLSVSSSQCVLNITEALLTTSFPIDALRDEFGENVPNFPISATYVFDSSSRSERLRFTAYDLAWSDALTYIDSLVGAGYTLLSQSENYFRAIDLVHNVQVSAYLSGSTGGIQFEFLGGSSTEMERFASFADLAEQTVKSNYSVDPYGFDYSLLPEIPEGAEVRSVFLNGQNAAIITKAGQDFIDALNAMSTADPVTGGRVLLENGNGCQLLLLDAALGDDYCTVKLVAMRELETVNYEVANELITDRVQGSIKEFSPVFLAETDAPFVIQYGERICFLDGSGDAALASIRAALAADSRFDYSPVDDAYVVPGEYFAYSFSHEDYEFPSRTVLRIGYYPYAVAADYVSVNDLSGEVKTLLGHFPALPDCGEKYLNISEARMTSTGEDGEVYISEDFDASNYFASLKTAGFQEHEGSYFREEGGYFYSVKETHPYVDGHQRRALSFGYYPFLAENEFSSIVGEKVASTLPSSFDSAPFFRMRSYEDEFVWNAPSTYDLNALSDAMLAKGWNLAMDKPTAKEFSRLDTVTGIVATLSVSSDEIGIRFEYRMKVYDFGFVPTKLGLCELGVGIRFVDTLLGAVLPDDGTIGYRGSYEQLSLLAVGIDFDAYCAKLEAQGMKVSKGKEGQAEAYDGATGMRYIIEKSAEGCYQINVYGEWKSDPFIVSDEDFAAYADTKGFADVAPNLGSAIVMDQCEKITFDPDYLEIAFYGGWNVGESSIQEYLVGQGYAEQVDPLDEKNTYYVRTDANYEYRIYLYGPTRLVITRR